jgi:hypothetical protein
MHINHDNQAKLSFHSWLLVFLLLVMTGQAQADESAPFLWKIVPVHQQQNTGLFPVESWLFGTIHSAHPDINNLSPAVDKAFNQSDRFYSELDATPATVTEAMSLSMLPPGESLQLLLPVKLQERIDRLLQDIHPALNFAPFSQLKIWALSSSLSLLEEQIQFGLAAPMDLRLYQQALTDGKEVSGLETVSEQVDAMEILTLTEQQHLLESTLDEIELKRQRNEPVLAEMYRLYQHGDLTLFGELMRRQFSSVGELGVKLERALITTRNRRMAERIDRNLSQYPDKQHFFAVGAGHFVGPTGIQQQLREMGYRIERVN